MKKLAFFLSALMLVFAVSCGPKPGTEPDQPDQPDQPQKEEVNAAATLAGATYYGSEYMPQGSTAEEVDMWFMSDGLYINEDGYIDGDGYYVTVYFYGNVDATTLMPAAGTYTVNDTYAANTILAGYDPYADVMPGYMTDGCLVQKVADGQLEATYFITSGSATISGDATNATIAMDFTAEEGHFVFNFSGAVEVNDYRTMPYADYEDATPTTATVSCAATIEPVDGFEGAAYVTAEDAATGLYFSSVVFYDEAVEGSYVCGENAEDQSVGTFMYSAGVSNGSVYPTFLAYITSDGYLDPEQPMFFIVDGTMTITADQVTGTLTSFFGSTITLNCPRTDAAAKAPRMAKDNRVKALNSHVSPFATTIAK